MKIDDKRLKREGFRPKSKNRNELMVEVEVAPRNYISISIFKQGDNWSFSGIEIEGDAANIARKECFTTYSMEEIMAFLQKY